MDRKPAPYAILRRGEDIACLSVVRQPDSVHRLFPAPVSNIVYHLHRSGVTGNAGQ